MEGGGGFMIELMIAPSGTGVLAEGFCTEFGGFEAGGFEATKSGTGRGAVDTCRGLGPGVIAGGFEAGRIVTGCMTGPLIIGTSCVN